MIDSEIRPGYLPYDCKEAVEHYRQAYSRFWEEFPRYLLDDYVQAVKQCSNSQGLVLCVGSGLGDEARILQNQGLKTICCDSAMEMVRASAGNNQVSVRGNFLKLPFMRDKFDGVWTYKALNHAQDANQLEIALLEIKRVLKYKGILGICMLKGKQDDRKSSFFNGISTRENLYLTESTFQELLEDNNFPIECFATLRRKHTDYLIANAVNFNRK